MQVILHQNNMKNLNRHLASEPHIRIQLATAYPKAVDAPLWDNYHGELLLLCLDGKINVVTANEDVEIGRMDQILLFDGEPFQYYSANADGYTSIVELIWTPGPNPCKYCYDIDKRFFDPQT